MLIVIKGRNNLALLKLGYTLFHQEGRNTRAGLITLVGAVSFALKHLDLQSSKCIVLKQGQDKDRRSARSSIVVSRPCLYLLLTLLW